MAEPKTRSGHRTGRTRPRFHHAHGGDGGVRPAERRRSDSPSGVLERGRYGSGHPRSRRRHPRRRNVQPETLGPTQPPSEGNRHEHRQAGVRVVLRAPPWHHRGSVDGVRGGHRNGRRVGRATTGGEDDARRPPDGPKPRTPSPTGVRPPRVRKLVEEVRPSRPLGHGSDAPGPRRVRGEVRRQKRVLNCFSTTLSNAERGESGIDEELSIDEQCRDDEFEDRHRERHYRRVVARNGDAERRAELPLVGVEQREAAFAPEHVECIVGENADPDELEVAELQRKDVEQRENRKVVERLSVFAEGGIHVRKERTEDDGHAHRYDGVERGEVARRVENIPETDTEKCRIQNVFLPIHSVAGPTPQYQGFPFQSSSARRSERACSAIFALISCRDPSNSYRATDE